MGRNLSHDVKEIEQVTHTEQLQLLFHDYEKHLGKPATLPAAIEWGLANGRIAEPKPDPKAILIRDMRNALRAETSTDAEGREYRVNAAVTFTRGGGIQESFWGTVDLKTTPEEFLSEWIGQRRKGVVDDCAKIKADVDHINTTYPDRKPIQLVLDFTDDVAEKEAAKKHGKGDGDQPDGGGSPGISPLN
jgi:hypothetical protein